MILYKFRSNYKFIKEELQEEYLYFAESAELNDPLEGFIKLYWKGDSVLWKNLLKHYLYTLANTVLQIAIAAELKENELPIFFDEGHFPTSQYKSLFEEIRDDYFEKEDIKDLLLYLEKVKHKIFEKKLVTYIKFIHFTALNCIIKRDEKTDDEREKEADKYAGIYLNQDKVLEIGQQYGKYLNASRLSQICEQTKVSIPVALGMLQHFGMLDWRQFAKFKIHVKGFIPEALIRG